MFPQITKKKKKDYIVSDVILKEWESISHELQGRTKLALKKIPTEILNDFNKVCRIKSIPEFYANYFICFIQKADQKEQQLAFSETVEDLLTHKSYFHIINEILKQRQEIISKIRDSLLLVQAFVAMNHGKSVSLSVKAQIEQLVKGCQTLQKLKELEKTKTEELVKLIVNIRTNTINLIQKVLQWRKHLQHLGKTQIKTKNAIKIIYPHQAINCLALPFYDLLFIKNSNLKAQINFGKQEQDPFLLGLARSKKGTQIQEYFFEGLALDTFNYKDYQSILRSQLPLEQSVQQRQKLASKQRVAEKTKLENSNEQKFKKQKEDKSQQVRIRNYSSSKNLNDLKQKRDQMIDRGIAYRSLRGGRSANKIINVDALLKVSAQPIKNAKKETKAVIDNQRANSFQHKVKQKQINIQQQKKRLEPYHKSNRKNAANVSLYQSKQQEQNKEKKQSDKLIKEQNLQRSKMQKLLKQAQKKANRQAKQFEQKIKRYEEEIANLKTRAQSDNKKINREASSDRNDSPIKQSRNSIIDVYSSRFNPKQEDTSLIQARLQQQSRANKNIQVQISELLKQKSKAQKMLEKQASKFSSQSQSYNKKIQRYEQIISNLKNQSQNNKKLIKQMELNTSMEQKQKATNLKMYQTKQRQEQFKNQIKAQISERQARKKNKRLKLMEEDKKKQLKREQIRSDRKYRNRSQKSLDHSANLSHKDLEIIKTTQTIQIVFQKRNDSKKPHQSPKQQMVKTSSRLIDLQKQRQLLSRKLQLSSAAKEQKNKLYESKIQQRDLRMDRFKEEIKRERDKNTKLQQSIRQIKRSMASQLEINLQRQKSKFEEERHQLLFIIEQERQQKSNKDRYLQQQMKFLKQMEKNQMDLMQLLDQEKKQKRERERLIAEQLQKKEQLINLMTLEEIKKDIERQVREELPQSDAEDQQDRYLKEYRQKVEAEIENFKSAKYQEISEMNQQNQKLKELISRIKGQQNKLLQAIRQNIELQSDPEEIIAQDLPITQHVSPSPKNQQIQLPDQSQVNIQLDKSIVLKELQLKTELQFRSQQKIREDYTQIANSSNFKEKEKIQNIIELYLKKPNQTHPNQSSKIDPEQKRQIVEKVTRNAKLIQSFEKELFSVKKLPAFVPSVKNSLINNHLLNLRQEYNDYQAESLRRQLFPPLEGEVYDEKELSYEEEEPPIVSIMDEVNDHAKKYPLRKDDRKNFLAINRMRLMLLEDEKKEKQRKMIEQESKKKIQKLLSQKQRKRRERQLQRQRQLLALQQPIKQKDKPKQTKKIKINRQPEFSIQDQRLQTIQKVQTQKDSKAKDTIRNSQATHQPDQNKLQRTVSKEPSPTKIDQQQPNAIINVEQNQESSNESYIVPSQAEQPSDHSQSLQDKYSLNQQNLPQVLIQQQKPLQEQIKNKNVQQQPRLMVQQKPIQQLQAQKQEQYLQQIQTATLKQQVLSLQQQIRSFIDAEAHYDVYQQFIPAEQAQNRIQQILDLSSSQIVNLNGNKTLKNDIALYSTIGLLIAKDSKGIQIGIGIYHKQLQTGEYVCDYVVAHNMLNFLNLVFNLSRFIFHNDENTNRIQYIFNLEHIQQRQTLLSFLQFQKKCKRMGEVYVKSLNLKQRKYVLRRALFQEVNTQLQNQSKGIQFKLTLQVYQDLLKQIDLGFKNTCNLNYGSISIILAYYLSKNADELALFRSKFEQELYYQQMLLTALLFKKKQIQIKNFIYSQLTQKQKSLTLTGIKQKFDMSTVEGSISEMKLCLEQKLPLSLKRCILTVAGQQINYVAFSPQQAVTRIQSSNSSETGIFLSIIPKYKLLIIEAEQFLTMSSKNSDLTAFFYVKHFIKNIIDVKKEVYEKVYMPEVAEDDLSYFHQMSKTVDKSLFLQQTFRVGWKTSFGNSLIFKPKHSDLVIQRPFIMALLSGAVERAVEGSPVCVKLII